MVFSHGSTGRSVLSSWLAGDSVLLTCGLLLQEVYDVCMVACPQKLKINRFYWYCHYCCFSWPFYWLLNLFGWKFTDEFKVLNLSEQCVVVCVFRGGTVEVGKVRLTSMTRLLFEEKKINSAFQIEVRLMLSLLSVLQSVLFSVFLAYLCRAGFFVSC